MHREPEGPFKDMPNKETKALQDKGYKIWGGTISSNIDSVPMTDFEKAKKSTGPESELYEEIRAKKALLKELRDLEAMNAGEEILGPLKQKLGLKTNGNPTSIKNNAEKITLLQLAGETEDPDIKAVILDMIFPERMNDPVARLERVVRSKATSKPKEDTNVMLEWMKEEMKYWRERANEPGASPIEMFTEMTKAIRDYNETNGIVKKPGSEHLDPSTVDGIRNIKKFGEDMGWFENKADKLEVRKLDMQEKIELKKIEVEENKFKREMENTKEQMEIAKEGAEILGKAFTKMFGKGGDDNSEIKTRKNVPVVMHCTNPECKYSKEKGEKFEISKPEDIGPKNEGRIFSCANDRGGCKMKYLWKGFMNGDVTKPIVEIIEDGTEEKKAN